MYIVSDLSVVMNSKLRVESVVSKARRNLDLFKRIGRQFKSTDSL